MADLGQEQAHLPAPQALQEHSTWSEAAGGLIAVTAREPKAGGAKGAPPAWGPTQNRVQLGKHTVQPGPHLVCFQQLGSVLPGLSSC